MIHIWKPANYSHADKYGSVSFTTRDNLDTGWLNFQDGPIKEYGVNGVTNEEIIEALVERIEGLNQPPYNCRENSLAITHLQEALHWLEHRTKARQARGVEGTSTP